MKDYSEDEYLQLANEAGKFINTPLGKYLQQQAAETVVDVSNELLNVDPNDSKKIQELQNLVHRYNDSIGWITSLIAAGNSILDQREE